jgi:hypothetical protein
MMTTRMRRNLTIASAAVATRAKRGMDLVDLRSLGIFPTIDGRDAIQGYNAAGDLVGMTSDGFDLNQIWSEFQAAVAALNATRQPIIDLLTFPVSSPIERVAQISSSDFEEASEYGEPIGQRPTGSYFTLGFDFKWYDLATRFTWKFLADAPTSQVEATSALALEADNRLTFKKVMEALYNSQNRVADINDLPVNVYALYNNDGTVPPTYKTNTFLGTHTHYLTSGAATIDSGDLDALYEHLRHHGYSMENGVSHLLLVNPREGQVIRTFRVLLGDTYDFIPSTSQPGQLQVAGLTLLGATQPPGQFAGLNVIGRYGPMLIIEDDMFPVGYTTLVGSGGEANLNNPVGLREHSNVSLRGLRLVKGPNPDYPLIDSFYNRGFGTGVRQRGGSAVMQITAAVAYTNPTL